MIICELWTCRSFQQLFFWYIKNCTESVEMMDWMDKLTKGMNQLLISVQNDFIVVDSFVLF